ncbi:MAG: class I SAM-dependent methyltransferase [Candidatus Woesearchaeota archaeon]|jgi:ubiquinone/menaquinone biosynthesis C-methylase UbiE
MENRNYQNKKKEAIFFDKFSNQDYDVFTKKGYVQIINQFRNQVKPKKGEILVDFGCGTGAFTKHLLSYGVKIIGIDLSKGCINYAKKHVKGIKFETGDIEKTRFKDNSVDIIVFSGVLHHFDDFSKTIQEAYRILKKGGRIFAYDPNKKNPVMWLYRDKHSPIHSKTGRTDNERLLTKREIVKVLNRFGYEEIKVYGISKVTYSYVESKLGRIFLLPLYNAFESLFPSFLSKKYGSFLISVAKK